MDNLLQRDRSLAELFAFVDKRVGLKNVVIVLSADPPVLEASLARSPARPVVVAQRGRPRLSSTFRNDGSSQWRKHCPTKARIEASAIVRRD
jgi:hypothetical protein